MNTIDNQRVAAVTTLESLGYTFSIVDGPPATIRGRQGPSIDGAESVAKAASECPDLVLMDIQLPRLDGYDATRQIKALHGCAAIPIIAASSFAMKGDEGKARAAGCPMGPTTS